MENKLKLKKKVGGQIVLGTQYDAYPLFSEGVIR